MLGKYLTFDKFLHAAHVSVCNFTFKRGEDVAYAHSKTVIRKYTWHHVKKVVVVFVQFDCLERNGPKHRPNSWRKLALWFPTLCQKPAHVILANVIDRGTKTHLSRWPP